MSFLRKISNQTVAQATIILALGTLGTKLLGFLREVVIAALFGATKLTDAFLVALILPINLGNLISNTILVGFIPIFSKKLKEDENEALKFASAFFTSLFLTFLNLVIILFLLAGPLASILAPGFTPQLQLLTAKLIRIMVPSLPLLALIGLLTGIIQSYKHFIIPTLATLTQNLTVIIIALLFTSQLGIFSLAWGILLGSLLNFLLIYTYITNHKFIRFQRGYGEEIKKAYFLILPVFIGSSAGYINLIIDRIIASSLSEGSIAALGFSIRIMELPLAIMAYSFIAAAYPTIASQTTKWNKETVKDSLMKNLRFLWFITIPISIFYIFFRTPITQLIYERGAFSSIATFNTASSLMYYSIGLFAYAGAALVTRTFYALLDTKTPLFIGINMVVLNAFLDLGLSKIMGHNGIALATSIVGILNLLSLLLILNFKFQLDLPGKYIIQNWIKLVSLATVLCGSFFILYLRLTYTLSQGWIYLLISTFFFVSLLYLQLSKFLGFGREARYFLSDLFKTIH